MNHKIYKRCIRGLWDTTVPGIQFDENGVSNYAKMFDKLCEIYPKGTQGLKVWENIVDKIKEKGKKNKYDCIIGVSGGTDSSYLLYIAKKIYDLRPLAVNLDNGWNSDIALENIKLITTALDIDLETYVIDYEEVKAVLRAYMKAVLPWIDGPTDIAINSALYNIAHREKIPFILIGSDFRTEGKQPREWTYTDFYQLRYLVQKFSNTKLKTFPILSHFGRGIKEYLLNIKMVKPFNFLSYNKVEAREFLIKEFNWKYYGEHHHENIFTKFTISYWLYEKFNIDKRIITYSAQVLSNFIDREKAINILKQKPYNLNTIQSEIDYVLKKLEISRKEFSEIWAKPNKFFYDYPNRFKTLFMTNKIINLFRVNRLLYKPLSAIEFEFR